MSDLPKERPRLHRTPKGKCRHPKLVPLLKFRGFDDIVYRCMVCGMSVTTSDLQGKMPWERGRRINK